MGLNGLFCFTMSQLPTKPHFTRFSSPGIIKGAKYIRLRNIGNANVSLFNTFLAPGEKIEFSVKEKSIYLDDLAFDASGTILEVVTLGGEPLIKNLPPSITLNSPDQDSSVTLGGVTLTAIASDSDGSILSVHFKVNGAIVGEVGTSPYTFEWFPRVPGIYTLSAVATDDKYEAVESSEVRVYVVQPI